MKKFQIEIRETLSHIEEISASSLDEAISIAMRMYKSEEIILDYQNHTDTEFIEVC